MLENIIQALANYFTKDAQEQKMVAQTIAFVKSQPQCLHRSLALGHLTASVWITDHSRNYVLLTHHQKLDKWLQLGGHADGEPDLKKVALTEAKEESGIQAFSFISKQIFDVDIHLIPARHTEPAHLHYDVRYLLETDKQQPLLRNHESKALAWIAVHDVARRNGSESILRMVRKHLKLFNSMVR